MKIYRYEKEDGGGPYVTFDGKLRSNNTIVLNDDYLFGCLSLESLNEYFDNDKNILKDCHLVIYEIPDNEVTIEQRQVIFPKNFSPYYKPVSTIPFVGEY